MRLALERQCVLFAIRPCLSAIARKSDGWKALKDKIKSSEIPASLKSSGRTGIK